MPSRTRKSLILELSPIGYIPNIASLAELKQAIHDVLLGLSFLHNRNFVHRDVRWANVIQDRTGGFRLIDLENSGPVGKPKYDSPAWPQLERDGVFNAKSDVKMVWTMAKEFYGLWTRDHDAEDFMSKLEQGEKALDHPWMDGVS